MELTIIFKTSHGGYSLHYINTEWEKSEIIFKLIMFLLGDVSLWKEFSRSANWNSD